MLCFENPTIQSSMQVFLTHYISGSCLLQILWTCSLVSDQDDKGMIQEGFSSVLPTQSSIF